MINTEFGRKTKVSDMAYLEVISQHLFRHTTENNEINQGSQPEGLKAGSLTKSRCSV